jgi:hypothetical protein
MKYLLIAVISIGLLMIGAETIAAPKACEGLKMGACIDRADCAWTKSKGKGKSHCRTLKAQPR